MPKQLWPFACGAIILLVAITVGGVLVLIICAIATVAASHG